MQYSYFFCEGLVPFKAAFTLPFQRFFRRGASGSLCYRYSKPITMHQRTVLIPYGAFNTILGDINGDSGCLMSNIVDVSRLAVAVDPSQWFAPETAMVMMATKSTILPC
jgi:hypothetical protein